VPQGYFDQKLNHESIIPAGLFRVGMWKIMTYLDLFGGPNGTKNFRMWWPTFRDQVHRFYDTVCDSHKAKVLTLVSPRWRRKVHCSQRAAHWCSWERLLNDNQEPL
jgi:hypothetical protein